MTKVVHIAIPIDESLLGDVDPTALLLKVAEAAYAAVVDYLAVGQTLTVDLDDLSSVPRDLPPFASKAGTN
jgi:hypothetical protein